MSEAAFTLLEMRFACKKCGIAKPSSDFSKEPRNRSGRFVARRDVYANVRLERFLIPRSSYSLSNHSQSQ